MMIKWFTASKIAVRYFIGFTVILLAVFLFLQFDIPSFAGTFEKVVFKYYDRQVQALANRGEDPLKSGWMYYNLGAYEKSRAIMEEVTRQEKNISAIYCLGLIDLKQQQPEAAAKKFEIIAGQAPNHVATKVALGKAYFQMKYFAAAKENLEQALAADPGNAEARLLIKNLP